MFIRRVFMVCAAVGGGHRFQYAVCNEIAQPRRQDVLGDAEALLELAEAAQAIEGIAHDQQRPDVPDGIERARHRAARLGKTGPFHSQPLQTGPKIRLDSI